MVLGGGLRAFCEGLLCSHPDHCPQLPQRSHESCLLFFQPPVSHLRALALLSPQPAISPHVITGPSGLHPICLLRTAPPGQSCWPSAPSGPCYNLQLLLLPLRPSPSWSGSCLRARAQPAHPHYLPTPSTGPVYAWGSRHCWTTNAMSEELSKKRLMSLHKVKIVNVTAHQSSLSLNARATPQGA